MRPADHRHELRIKGDYDDGYKSVMNTRLVARSSGPVLALAAGAKQARPRCVEVPKS